MQAQFNDGLNFLSKLTLGRTINAAKVFISYYYSKLISKPIQMGLPISISIEPTTSCNLRCPECPSGLRSFTRPTGMLQKEMFNQSIDELCKSLTYLVFYFQGEPYLNPAFLDMVKYASQKKIYTATSTNAHYLTDANAKQTVESGMDRIIISVDGASQDTYEQYRVGGNLEKVKEGIRNIVKWKKDLKSKTPFIILQFLVTAKNEHEISDIKILAKELGVDDMRFKTAQIYDYENGSELIPVNKKYSRYKENANGTYSPKNKLQNHCWKLWHASVITWDGTVVPCCFDKDSSHKMGSLQKNSFKEIWRNNKYNEFRNSLMKSRKEIEICKNCSEGLSVWES